LHVERETTEKRGRGAPTRFSLPQSVQYRGIHSRQRSNGINQKDTYDYPSAKIYKSTRNTEDALILKSFQKKKKAVPMRRV